jgi:hypothetical protein
MQWFDSPGIFVTSCGLLMMSLQRQVLSRRSLRSFETGWWRQSSNIWYCISIWLSRAMHHHLSIGKGRQTKWQMILLHVVWTSFGDLLVLRSYPFFSPFLDFVQENSAFKVANIWKHSSLRWETIKFVTLVVVDHLESVKFVVSCFPSLEGDRRSRSTFVVDDRSLPQLERQYFPTSCSSSKTSSLFFFSMRKWIKPKKSEKIKKSGCFQLHTSSH